jgi:hypothetical protein
VAGPAPEPRRIEQRRHRFDIKEVYEFAWNRFFVAVDGHRAEISAPCWYRPVSKAPKSLQLNDVMDQAGKCS